MPRYQTLEVRFWSKVEKTATCWNWIGAKNNNGYGMLYVDGKKPVAHRVSLSMVGRVIPDGMQVDHLCRNRACVNPDHLDIVTPSENGKRGTAGLTAKVRGWARTHCKQGHKFTPENTYDRPDRGRGCRTCRAASVLKRKEAQRDAR